MAKLKSFDGYDKGIIKFFEELATNNNKEWFEEHRKYYEKEIRDKSKSLAADLGKLFLLEHKPYVADPKISMFRINRDIRFSENKDPYKTNLGMTFPFTMGQAVVKKSEALALYFHIDATQVFIGGGMVSPMADKLKLIRERIADDYEILDNIINAQIFKENFPNSISFSEPLKRVPKGFEKEHPAAEWLKKKDFGFWGPIDSELIYSEELLEVIKYKSDIFKPFMEFVHEAITIDEK